MAQDPAPRVPRRQGVRLDRRRPSAARRVGHSLQPRAAAPVDRADAADRTVPARRAQAGPAETVEPEQPPTPTSGDDPAGERDRARSASPPRSTRPGGGSRARPSRWSAKEGWCSSSIVVCSSPPTPAGTPSTSRPPGSNAAGGCGPQPGGDRGVGDSQGRRVRQRVLRRHQLPGRLEYGVARSKSPSSVTPSRSRSATAHPLPPGPHDRTREHGALANPGGRPHRINAA